MPKGLYVVHSNGNASFTKLRSSAYITAYSHLLNRLILLITCACTACVLCAKKMCFSFSAEPQ